MTFSFTGCTLNFASFYQVVIKQLQFKDCKLIGADFTEADLSEVQFETCDLSKAIFANTQLTKANFKTAFNYRIDPEKNRLKGAKFSAKGIAGLLNKYEIYIE